MADFDPIKIPFELPTAEVLQDTERIQGGFSDVDKSVQKAENRFNSWVKSQLQGVKATGGNVTATQKYNSVLATLEQRMRKAQDPKIVQAYANAIGKLKKEVATLGANATAMQPMKKGFDGLGNSINMITRDLPAFTYSAQTGFMAISNNIPMLADEIGRLTARNKELLASGQQTKPVWKQVLGSLLSWQTALSMGIVLLTVYGKEIGEWIGGLFKGKKAVEELEESQKALNEGLKSTEYKKATREVLELSAKIKLAKKGLYDKAKALKEYNEILGKTVGTATNLKDAEQWLIDNKRDYVNMMAYKAAAAKMMDKAVDELVKRQEAQLKPVAKHASWRDKFAGYFVANNPGLSGRGSFDNSVFDKVVEDSGKRELGELVKKSEEDEATYSEIAEKFLIDADKIANALNLKDVDNDTPKKIASSREKLLEDIAKLDADYAQKSYAKDEQELQALRAKFDKMRKEVAKFNADPKNKVKIDAGQIDGIQQKAESDLLYRQGTSDLAKQLEQEKEMYSAYEAFKYDVGVREADKKYQRNLMQFGSYGEKLKAEIGKLEQEISQSAGSTPTGGQSERLTLLNAELTKWQNGQSAEQEQRFAEAYQSAVGHEERLLQIKQDYTQRKAEIEKIADAKIRTEKLQELEYQKNASIDSANAEAYEKASIYERLSTNLIGITRRELKNRIASLREYLNTAKGILSEEQEAFLQGELKKAEAAMANTEVGVQEETLLQRKHELITRIQEKQAKGLTNVQDEAAELEEVNAQLADIVAKKAQDFANKAGVLGGAFSELGGALKEYDEGVGDTVESMGDLLNVASDVGSVVANFASGNIIGGITSSIKAITGVLKIGARARESERKALEEIKKWHDEIFESQLAYNAELRERIKEEVKLNDIYKSRVENIKEELEANKKASQMVLEDQEAVFKRLLNAKTVVDKYTKKSGGFLGIGRKKKVVNVEKTVLELLGATAGSATRQKSALQKLFGRKNKQDKAQVGILKKFAKSDNTVRKFFSSLFGRRSEFNPRRRGIFSMFDRLNKRESAVNKRLIKNVFNKTKQVAKELKENEQNFILSDELFRKIEILNRDKPLTGDAKEAYETLKKLKKEYGSLARAKEELKIQLKDATVGFTARSIADTIREGVKSGKKTFADFAGDVEDFLRQALLAGMNMKIIEPEMQKLQDMLYGMLGDGVLSGDEKKQWQEAYTKVAKEASVYVDMMNNAGISVAKQTNSANSLKGAIRGMTENQADLLAGQFGGLRLTQLDTNRILRSSHLAQMKRLSESIRITKQIEINTRKTAENTAGMREGLKSVETAVKSTYNTAKANGI